ncbi:signal transduction histidine kinase [Crossiella equi]|uniref:histidine kinase n=1 Tax=Crossiella equi TaxID=130796 RepID=A0ABS5A443_9PSEU|nr:sensor histidine kinase [Crossiella equi]MBP2471311.1 signal transduction histidine kinase [Crossiella equi]
MIPKPWRGDAALAALVLLAVGAAVTASVGRAGPDLLGYAFTALLAGLMFLRRRQPELVLVLSGLAVFAYYWIEQPPIGLAVPLAAAVYSAAEQGRPRFAIGTVAALMVVSTAARLLEGDDPATVLGLEFGSALALFAAVLALGDSVRSRRAAREAALLDREREAAARVEQERLRIARDLHDLLAHTVSVISLHTDVARETLREDPERAERSLTAVRTACSEVVHELRATLGALRTTENAPVPGLARLPELLASAGESGLTVRVRTEGEPGTLSAMTDATAYRVLQESLSNVRRHAHASTVDITMAHTPEELTLTVRDNGRGPTGESTGWGITGMRERVQLLGGRLHTTTPPDGGFQVEARLPLRGRT